MTVDVLRGVIQTSGGAHVARHARDGEVVVALEVTHGDGHGSSMTNVHPLRPALAREIATALNAAADEAENMF
jgi:hypothetical protein